MLDKKKQEKFVHRQEKIGIEEHHLPHNYAWPSQSNEWPKIETASYPHVWSHQRWPRRRWSHIMSSFYTDETETLAFDSICFHVGYHKNKQQTILQDNKKIFNNFEFTFQLGKALVLSIIQQCLENSNGLQIAVLQKVRRVLELPEVNRRPLPDPETAVTHKWLVSQVRWVNIRYQNVEKRSGKAEQQFENQVLCLFGFHLYKAPIQDQIHLWRLFWVVIF